MGFSPLSKPVNYFQEEEKKKKVPYLYNVFFAIFLYKVFYLKMKGETWSTVNAISVDAEYYREEDGKYLMKIQIQTWGNISSFVIPQNRGVFTWYLLMGCF